MTRKPAISIGGIETIVDDPTAILAGGLIRDAQKADNDPIRSRHVNTRELLVICGLIRATLRPELTVEAELRARAEQAEAERTALQERLTELRKALQREVDAADLIRKARRVTRPSATADGQWETAVRTMEKAVRIVDQYIALSPAEDAR